MRRFRRLSDETLAGVRCCDRVARWRRGHSRSGGWRARDRRQNRSAGYVHAVIGGSEKCLRAGEFCTHAYDRQYRRYGFRCIRYYANVQRYRLTHA
jgi:hypothetical protein